MKISYLKTLLKQAHVLKPKLTHKALKQEAAIVTQNQTAWNRNLVGHTQEDPCGPKHAWPYLLRLSRLPLSES